MSECTLFFFSSDEQTVENVGQVSQRNEPSLDLSLDIPSKEETSIEDCFQHSMRVQHLVGEDQFYCDHCASKQDATVTTFVSDVSKIVTLHLKRFRWEDERGHVKVAGKVKFPLHLAAADIVPSSAFDNKRTSETEVHPVPGCQGALYSL